MIDYIHTILTGAHPMKFKPLAVLPLLLLCSCSMNNEISEEIPTDESQPYISTSDESEEISFTGTMETLPSEQELSPAEPLKSLNIQPSDYFTPGVYTSEYTDDTGNFYIFSSDGLHGKLIPMADAEGVDFTYSINGDSMTMYVGEELTPYQAELEKTENGTIIIHMTFLGTQDELTYLSGVSADDFTFYPARRLAQLARKYYEDRTGITLEGVEYKIIEGDMVVLNLWVPDENGWRSDVDSFTVSMFSAKGWSSITYDDIDLSTVVLEKDEPAASNDADIQDVTAESFAAN